MTLNKFAYAALIGAGAAAFAFGSTTPGLAKAKKTAAPPAHPEVCLNVYMPVCGAKGGMKFTYANACSAEKDGATVVSNKACAVKTAHRKTKKMKM